MRAQEKRARTRQLRYCAAGLLIFRLVCPRSHPPLRRANARPKSATLVKLREPRRQLRLPAFNLYS